MYLPNLTILQPLDQTALVIQNRRIYHLMFYDINTSLRCKLQKMYVSSFRAWDESFEKKQNTTSATIKNCNSEALKNQSEKESRDLVGLGSSSEHQPDSIYFNSSKMENIQVLPIVCDPREFIFD